MGIIYSYWNKCYYMLGGVFMDNEVNNLKKVLYGYVLDGRVVYCLVLDSKKFIYIGFVVNYCIFNEFLNEEDKNIFIYKFFGVSMIDNWNIVMVIIDYVVY